MASTTPSAVLYNTDRLILIGASTGGVDALQCLLKDYPQHGPPLMIVQHTGDRYLKSLARHLDRHSEITVKSAVDGEALRPGHAYLAPSTNSHLCLSTSTQLHCRLLKKPEVGGHRPSIDALFYSAVPHAKRISAAILTGMGRDGAAGLLALYKAGAKTFAQNQSTSLVYGMPKAALQLGAVGKEIAIDEMASNLLETCLSHKSSS